MAARKPEILITRHVYMTTAIVQRLPPYNQSLGIRVSYLDIVQYNRCKAGFSTKRGQKNVISSTNANIIMWDGAWWLTFEL